MARFRSRTQGTRGEASRLGHGRLWTKAATWRLEVDVDLSAKEAPETRRNLPDEAANNLLRVGLRPLQGGLALDLFDGTEEEALRLCGSEGPRKAARAMRDLAARLVRQARDLEAKAHVVKANEEAGY